LVDGDAFAAAVAGDGDADTSRAADATGALDLDRVAAAAAAQADAYSGAPTPTTGFLSGAGKIAGVAALFRLFAGPFATPELSGGLAGWTTLAFFAAVASIVVGNLVALTQKRVRRMLAWSSVAHAGYLLLALCALGVKEAAAGSIRAVILYGAAYAIANAGAFIVLAAFGRDKAEVETLDELSGLGRKHPAMGLALSLFLISAAGLPPAAGFVAKLSLFSTAFAAGEGAATPAYCAEMLQWLAVGGLVLSVLNAAVYLPGQSWDMPIEQWQLQERINAEVQRIRKIEQMMQGQQAPAPRPDGDD
jgi:NADH:ubiquinone oxidoreductase subunit 2 (subunit N)